ncbi:MAG: InlB B-repeat-containing protein, partial [Clostridia bacterium]|nr:InlB B-repeat-containing protein [Clostridia bacterium]
TFALSVDAAQVNIQLWVYIGDSGVNANFSAHWNTFGGGIYKANGFNSLDTGASLRDVLKTRNAACITDLESNLTRTGYDLVGFDISKFGVATVSTVPSFVNNTAAWWPVAYISYDDFVAGNTNSLVYGSTADNWAFQLLPDWKPKTYTLTLDAGEGTIDGDKTKTYSIKYNQSYKDAFGGTFPTPVREGYEFQYYDYNNGQFGLHTGSWENNYYNITWSDTMTAVWKCKHENTTVINSVAATCTQAGSETVKCGTCNETFTTTIAKLEHNRQWVSSDGVNRYDLYRCKYVNCNYSFTHKRITVTYNANGGALIVDGKKINDPTKNAYHELETTDENAVVPVTPPYEAEMPGAEFLGWSTDPYATKADTTFSSDINYTLHAVYGKETYTITFDAGQDDTLDPPRKGTLPEGLNEVVNIQYGVLLKEAISATIPEPKLPGYTFGGWQEYNNGKEGTLYTAENWETARYTPNPVGSTIFKAVFVPNEKHTLTLNLHDGTLPSGYQASYTFLEGQYFNDVIGGFPVPTKTGNAFKGWQWNNRTDHHWTDGWGVNQTYYFTGDIELDAIWKSTPYVFEFDLNADGDATAAQQTGFATKYGIDVGDPISTTVGGFPIPTRDKYNFVGWEMPVYDSEGNSVTKIFTRDKGWESTVYNYKGNTTAKAIWEIACRHKNDDGSYYELSWDTESDPLRHKGICENCETLAAYGYVVKFWS